MRAPRGPGRVGLCRALLGPVLRVLGAVGAVMLSVVVVAPGVASASSPGLCTTDLYPWPSSDGCNPAGSDLAVAYADGSYGPVGQCVMAVDGGFGSGQVAAGEYSETGNHDFQVRYACNLEVPCPVSTDCWGVESISPQVPVVGAEYHGFTETTTEMFQPFSTGCYTSGVMPSSGVVQYETAADYAAGGTSTCGSFPPSNALVVESIDEEDWGPRQLDSRGNGERSLLLRWEDDYYTNTVSGVSGLAVGYTVLAPCLDNACASAASSYAVGDQTSGEVYDPGIEAGCSDSGCGGLSAYGDGGALPMDIQGEEFFPSDSSVEPDVPDTAFVGGAGSDVTPCTLEYVTGPSGSVEMDAGTAYSYTFFFDGPVDAIIVDPNDTSGSTSGPYGTGSDAEEFPVAVGATDRLTFAIPTTSGAWDPLFYCVDAGTLYPWGSAASTGVQGASPGGVDCGTGLISATCESPPGSGGGAFDLSACISDIGSGLSLYNPVSWIEGAGEFGLCLLEWAFIPSTSAASSFLDYFGLSGNPSPSDAVPISEYVGGMGSMLSSFPTAALASMKTSADSGSCNSEGGSYSVGGQSVSVCGALAAVTSSGDSWSGSLVLIGEILAAIVYVLFGLALFHVVRRLMTAGGE